MVPWRPGCAHRERAWRWVRNRYATKHPDWEIVEAQAPEGPWCKAAAVMPAIERADADLIVVADADVWCDGLSDAVDALQDAPWAIPHRHVFRLTEASTRLMYAGADSLDLALEQRRYFGVAGGGIVVGRREQLLDAPMDPRFVGWGQEDESWALALACLAGLPWRGEAPLVHLWHPPQQRKCRRWGSREGVELSKRYRRARLDPDAMRSIVEEVPCSSTPA